MLHIRSYAEVWPARDNPRGLFLVMNDAGRKVGVIHYDERLNGPKWTWAINGEIVAGDVNANGAETTRAAAQDAIARNWRAWLRLHRLDESYAPIYSDPMSAEERRRLRLPG